MLKLLKVEFMYSTHASDFAIINYFHMYEDKELFCALDFS